MVRGWVVTCKKKKKIEMVVGGEVVSHQERKKRKLANGAEGRVKEGG